MASDPIKYAKNRAYEFVEAQQQALDSGTLTEAEWFDVHTRYFTEHYLAADNPRGQSGHGGDEARYRYTRMMILEAIHRSGTFLDVGCANGHLMESLSRWLQGSGLDVTFYGLDISEGLLALAKQRLPQWADRFYLGNALYWTPPMKFDFVYLMGVELVPHSRLGDLIAHLRRHYVKADGRFILGPVTEERDSRVLEETLQGFGYRLTGYCEKSHQRHEDLARKLYWLDNV